MSNPNEEAMNALQTPRGLAEWLMGMANQLARSGERRTREDALGADPEYLDGLHDAYATAANAAHRVANRLQDTVPMPQNVDGAKALVLLGVAWIKQHSPEELKRPADDSVRLDYLTTADRNGSGRYLSRSSFGWCVRDIFGGMLSERTFEDAREAIDSAMRNYP